MEFYCGPGNREEAIRKRLSDEDEAEEMATGDANALTAELLSNKGYLPGEIEAAPRCVVMGQGVSVDFVVRVSGRPFMAVKCSMAIDSRERHIVSFSRLAETEVIPVSVITDGLHAHVLDTATCTVTGEELDAIPTRETALAYLAAHAPVAYPAGKRERESRVLLAFETASCPRVEKKQ